LLKKHILILFVSLNLSLEIYADDYHHFGPSYNSLGQTGLIYTPSAEVNQDKSIFFTFNKNEIWKLGTLTATPFNWLEASYFYYRPDDLLWGGAEGLYLDKGFNVKFSYKPKYKNLPTLAIGLDDFAGTGQFTREYIASTAITKSTKFTLGIGWGKYVGSSSFKNPLGVIKDEFENRPTGFSNYGGSPEYSKWFRGDSTIFGGLEWIIPNSNGARLKFEYDPYDYNKFSCCGEGRGVRTESLRTKDSDYNFGFSFPLKDYGSVDINYVKGNTLNISFSLGITAKKDRIKRDAFKPKTEKVNFNTTKKDLFYRNLLHNLNLNNIYLQTATLENNKLSITVDSPDIKNQIQSSSRAARVAMQVIDQDENEYEIDFIDVGHILRGIEVNNLQYRVSDLNILESKIPEIIKKNTNLSINQPYKYREDEFTPIVRFPVIFNRINPEVRSHVGSPERFLYSGLGVSFDNEIQFSRALVLSSSIGATFYDNFDEKVSDPNSIVKHVRTEILDYMQDGDVYIKRLQLDYIWSPKREFYAKLSAGILEEMYGGLGLELLYKPFDQNFSIGYESFHVKRRTYRQMFDFFNEEEIDTNHINFSYMLNDPQILVKYSYGKYLAGDTGYTLDLSRVSNIGWRAGFYFTRTDMSFREFGEGSFDKGFYFSIPNDVLFKSLSKGSIGFSLKTMTRDGGQKLWIHNKLDDFFNNSNRQEIDMGWYGFYD
tara:strand:+ start:610 stop:2748 length:2139 start_codon:yes stop_codon:yes gene_type:complete